MPDQTQRERDQQTSIIVRMRFGSHLYGTASASSDRDFKGVFMPSKEQVCLSRVPKALTWNTKKGNDGKNTCDDIDTELYSLHYFLRLACEGQTVALDMLHAPDKMLLSSSEVWRRIVAERHRFYTKNLHAFVGYARRQASKYGIKGSRLSDAKKVIEFCDSVIPEARLKHIWDDLPRGEHILKHPEDENGVRMFEVCGRKTCETATIGYLRDTVSKFHKSYGERAEQAARNEGVDWKAVSHAFRAAFQVKQILTEKTITFPLREAGYLLRIKEGRLHYQSEVAPALEKLMGDVESLAAKSDLPASIDHKYWDRFLIKIVEERIASACGKRTNRTRASAVSTHTTSESPQR